MNSIRCLEYESRMITENRNNIKRKKRAGNAYSLLLNLFDQQKF